MTDFVKPTNSVDRCWDDAVVPTPDEYIKISKRRLSSI
jgi:hypothetical protein